MPEQEQMQPPPKKHVITFGGGPKPDLGPDLSGVTSDVNSLSRRVRMLEEGFTNMRRFFQVTEENSLSKNKHFSAEIKTITSDVMEIRKEIQDLKDKFQLVVRELQSVARKEEVKVLEKYINLWNPIKFVTQNEIEQIINEVLEKKRAGDRNAYSESG